MDVRIIASIPLELKSAIDKYVEEHDTDIDDLIKKSLENYISGNTDKPEEEDVKEEVKDKEDLSDPVELVRKVNGIKQCLKSDAENLHEKIDEINTILSGIEGPEVPPPDECKSKLQWLLRGSIMFSKFILDDLMDLIDIIVTDKSDNLELKKVYHHNKTYCVTTKTEYKEEKEDGDDDGC